MNNRSIQTNGIIIFSFGSNAAAPDGAPRGGSVKKILTFTVPPCLGEALRRNSHIYYGFHGNLSALPLPPGSGYCISPFFLSGISQDHMKYGRRSGGIGTHYRLLYL